MISIVVPTFNRIEHLKDTLNSILNQDYEDWELILVDDGSEFNFIKEVEQISLTNDKINFVKRSENSPKGASTCRNIGLNQAKGEHVVFLDSDDLLAPWCLKERIEFIKNNSELDFAVFPQLIFNDKVGDSNELWSKRLSKNNTLQYFLSLNSAWPVSGVIWKKDFITKNKLSFNENCASWQDCEFHLKALNKNPVYKWSSSKIPDGFIRFHKEERISGNNSIFYAIKRIYAINTIIPSLNNHQYKIISKHLKKYIIQEMNKEILYQKKPDYKITKEIISTSKLPTFQKLILVTYFNFIKFIKFTKLYFIYSLVRKVLKYTIKPFESNLNHEHLEDKEIKELLILLNKY